MFELVIGELDHILERFEEKEAPLEKQIAKMMLEASGDSELKNRIDELGNTIGQLRNPKAKSPSSKQKSQAEIGAFLNRVSHEVEVRP